MRSFDDGPTPQEEAGLSPALKRQLANAPDGLRLHLTRRLQTHLPLLRDRLHRLYGATPDFEPWFAALLYSVLDWALQRPLPLRQLDQQRHENPHWHQASTMLAYSAYVDRFAGTLGQVAQRIPHLQDLGVRYLHLLPFLRARHGVNDGGFAVASFEEVEPRLGTISDLRNLTDQLRQAHISLCADLVLNHVADDHPWALAARHQDPHYRAYFHVLDTPEQVRQQEAHLNQVFPQTAPGNFTYVPALQGWVWTTFYSYQWDLNYAHPAVFADMASALLRLANHGVEAFRLDSTAYLWKRSGTTCMNQPEVHWLLQALRCVVDIAAPGVLLKAEAIVPTRELPPYFGQAEALGRECQVAYHSSLMAAAWVALAEQDAELVHEVLRNTPVLPHDATWLTYVRCHDDIGWNVLRPELEALGDHQYQRLLHASQFFAGELPGSYARGATFQSSSPEHVHGSNGMTASLAGLHSGGDAASQQQALCRHLLMYALVLGVGGIPLIYMGDEFGQGNAEAQPGNAEGEAGADGRQIHRPGFDEQAFANRADPATLAGSVYQGLQQWLQARRRLPALDARCPLRLWPRQHPGLLGFERDGSLLALYNFTSVDCAADLLAFRQNQGARAWVNALSGDVLPATATQVNVPAWSCLWLTVQTP